MVCVPAPTIDDPPSLTLHLSSIAPYFGDLGDGVHKGDENDPRVAAIEVFPDEVRYWLATSGPISRGVQEIASAVKGEVTIPGELRTITKQEVSISQTQPRSHVLADIGPQIELIQGLDASASEKSK